MKLKDLYLSIYLVGKFECSIENNIVICDGVNRMPKQSTDYDLAELFLFNILSEDQQSFKEGVIVSFRKLDEKIIFGYRKLKFDVISCSFDEIIIGNQFNNFFIRRIRE